MKVLINSLLKFLIDKSSSASLNEDQKESVQVAIDSIQRAFRMNYNPEKPHYSLTEMFMSLEEEERNPEEAEKQKAKGNELLTQGKVEEAVDCYTAAIEYDPSSHVYYGNRAAAYIKLNQLDKAEEDCLRALQLNDNYSKAYARLGTIYMKKMDYVNAAINLSKACELEPTNSAYKDTLEQCRASMSSAAQENPLGPGQLPFALPENMDFNALLNNPALVQMAQNMMQNPQMQEMMANIMQNMGQQSPEGFNLSNIFGGSSQAKNYPSSNHGSNNSNDPPK